MSFSNPNFQFSRERRFPGISPTSALMEVMPAVINNLALIIKGQGVVIFKVANEFSSDISTTISFYNQNKSVDITLQLQVGKITLTQNNKVLYERDDTGLTTHVRAFYWVSLDAQKQYLRFGIGESRLETETFAYLFPNDHATKLMLESITNFSYDDQDISLLRLLRDPILDDVPLRVKNTDELTMDMIAEGAFMPKANLSTIAQKLYDNIAGKNFTLNNPDFPDFIEAIEHSIATPGCWCFDKLKEKAGEFGDKDPKKVYLRITLGQNGGESPGIPYVMEIWPAGCYSPIHNHAGANAVIRVLHGQIDVTLFPYLGTEQAFGHEVFSEGDITWISPTLNQFHKLKNPNESGQTCITIQCYMYDENDLGHYNYFDYISDDDEIKQYEPDSDMDFMTFKMIVKKEWTKK